MSIKLLKNETAVARGRRLRFVRNITGMTSEPFSKLCSVGRTTISSWEQAINPLTERGAEKVMRAVREEGIRCTALWLLHGIGEPPKVVNQEKLSKLNYTETQLPVSPSLEEIKTHYQGSDLEKEIELFKACYHEHLVHQIQDNVMHPNYRQGDWVGGIKLSKQALDLSHSMDCIVLVNNETLLIRRVKIESLGEFKISLYGSNAETSVEYPPLRHLPTSQILALAPIIRVWRSSLTAEKN